MSLPSGDSLLPPNATPQERALAETLLRLSQVPVEIDRLWDPWRCPAALLPWLAWALSVDYWRDDWPEATKRQVIAVSLQVHRIKGTPASIEEALSAQGMQAAVAEWFDYGGAPYFFKLLITLGGAGIDRETFLMALRTTLATKNTRSWLELIRLEDELAGELPAFATATVQAQVLDIRPPPPGDLELAGGLPAFAAAPQSSQTMTIEPGGL